MSDRRPVSGRAVGWHLPGSDRKRTRLTRPRPVFLVLAALAIAALLVSGCGKSEKDKYVDDYKPLNDRLLKVGESIGSVTRGAAKQTNEDLADQFSKNATELDDLKDDIAALDTPTDLKDESAALTRSIDLVVKDLKDISTAARESDKQAAGTATRALTVDAVKVNTAQNKLARATGADVGER
jgi:hypothetical protein